MVRSRLIWNSNVDQVNIYLVLNTRLINIHIRTHPPPPCNRNGGARVITNLSSLTRFQLLECVLVYENLNIV